MKLKLFRANFPYAICGGEKPYEKRVCGAREDNELIGLVATLDAYDWSWGQILGLKKTMAPLFFFLHCIFTFGHRGAVLPIHMW